VSLLVLGIPFSGLASGAGLRPTNDSLEGHVPPGLRCSVAGAAVNLAGNANFQPHDLRGFSNEARQHDTPGLIVAPHCGPTADVIYAPCDASVSSTTSPAAQTGTPDGGLGVEHRASWTMIIPAKSRTGVIYQRHIDGTLEAIANLKHARHTERME
jgi:hypothetical protein